MLEVQKYLREHSLEKLESELAIRSTKCEESGRVILNYDMIDSPKNHQIVRECRALTLDSQNNWQIVARSFPRFYNYGESPEHTLSFDWNNSRVEHKEDGSLIVIYWWNNQWHIQTRGSFGFGPINTFPITWKALVNQTLLNVDADIFNLLNKDFTYVCEICSVYNKIVTQYNQPKIFLLTVFNGENELNREEVVAQSIYTGIELPKFTNFNSIEQAKEYIDQIADGDPTFEGLVCVDRNNMRIKVKSIKYLELHRFKNNGHISLEDCIAIILRGDMDESLTYFPEMVPYFESIKEQIDIAEDEIVNVWGNAKHEGDQKTFALSVKDSKWSSFMFMARKDGKNPIDLFRSSPELVSKKLEKDQ